MERFVDAILKSVNDENWYGALFMSLTIPDICASISSENNKTDGRKYAAWFDEYLGSVYSPIRPSGEKMVFMTGDACYALRCSMLHNGEADLTSQKVKSLLSSIHFTTKSGHCNKVNSVLQLDVGRFCNDMCQAVLKWSDQVRKNKINVQKMDRLLTIHLGESRIMGGAIIFGVRKDSSENGPSD